RLHGDISASGTARRMAKLDVTERGLCLGRTDDEKRASLYIGRIGLRDDNYELKLIDWRAPAARPFYAATPRNPVGLVRRRHIYTRRRVVTGVDDEVFDLDKLSDKDRSTLSGEAALIAAVSAARTGRMADVVATIQAEQDRVIRADLPGVLVVQGGPGTGKTVAAALEDAASWSSGRTPPSCATSARCSRPSARPTWCCTPSATCSPA